MPRIRTLPRALIGALCLSFAVLVLQTMQQAPNAEAFTNCTVSDSFDAQEQAFLQLINQYRSQNGKPALTVSSNLNRASAWMAQDLSKGSFSHTDSLGRSAATRDRELRRPAV